MKGALVKLAVSLLVGALFVWLAARGVDWQSLAHAFVEVSAWHLLGYFLLLSVVQLVRIWRWGILLKPLGRVPPGRLLAAGSVGIMALILLPLRLGELARPLLVAERGHIRASAALATVVIERVVDALAMAALLALTLVWLGRDGSDARLLQFWALVVLGGFLGLLLLLLLAYFRRQAATRLCRRLLAPLSQRLANKAVSLLDSFIGGLHALADRHLLPAFLALTIVYWGLSGLGLVYMFSAFTPLEHLGLAEGFSVLAVLCVGLMIPAGPGMIGNFHYFVKLGLGLFVGAEVLAGPGLAYAIIVHAMQLGQQVLWGVAFLFSPHITAGRWLLAGNRELDDKAPPPSS